MTRNNLSEAKTALLSKWLQGKLVDDTLTIPRRPANTPVPLSFPQQRQLFLELLHQGTAVNNLSVLFELKGTLDLAAFKKSANLIVARHDSLRTYFSFRGGLPTPEILAICRIDIPVIDLQSTDAEGRSSKARELAERDVLQPFDLTEAPLIRLKLYVLDKTNYLFLLTVHHTIADGWSLGVFLRELMIVYENATAGKAIALPDLPIQYADFAHWQTASGRTDILQPSMNYWKKQLSGEIPDLELPTDQPRNSRQTFSGGTHRLILSKTLSNELEELSRHEDATIFMTLQAAFSILLHRFSGQDDILIGTPVASRNHPETENLIGVFINTLVLRTSLAGDPGFRQLLAKVRGMSLEAYANQEVPFEKLVEELKPKRDLSRTPIFQVSFNLQNSPMPKLDLPDLEIVPVDIDRGVSQFDLTLMVTRSDGQYHCNIEYNSDLFKAESIARMFGSFQSLLEHLVAEPDCRISRLRIMTQQELNQTIDGLNQTQKEFPREKCLHHLFEEQAQKTPGNVAVIHNGTSLTYRELNNRANALARQLKSKGVGSGVRVGIFMEKTLAVVEALLGTLKAGGTYLPIDTAFPAARVKFILDDADVNVILTNVDTIPLGETKACVIHLTDHVSSEAANQDNLSTDTSPGDVAYIIYTSGSTGNPKGVMVPHSALVNFLSSMLLRPGIKKDEVLLSVTSVSFDIAALELFLPLMVGATVVIADKEIMSNPVTMSQAIERYQVSMMQATPATWQLLVASGWSGNHELKALCGGDVLTRKLADQILSRVGSLWNMYGPTETTVWSAVNQLNKDESSITIGQPIGNTQLYILDRNMQPVPIGVPSELHIGGEGLATGYLNQTQLTSEKFIANCFSPDPVARLYKTGDRARFRADHSIEILGRSDDQVKIHGHRIELGEIASVLTQHAAVRDAVVILRQDLSGGKRLVAYFIAEDDQSPGLADLQNFTRSRLPAYMIPAIFVEMKSFPLTPSGKIDRNSLPVPGDIPLRAGYVAPRNVVEQTLVEIWQDVLEVKNVGVHDNFFDLGGASIQSLQVVAAASLAGIHLNAETIFEYQTIAELAENLPRK